MTLAAGTQFGPYKVLALIGAGGMGEVYSGTDTRLKRDVAIKVLPPLFATDADRLARFRREAEVLASLNHTNIAHIYGLEQSDGATALAMELVDGETLAERIARGPIDVDEALVIARQIADALEAAHARGIVHRDLKPGNVKLTPDGTVKVLDFGIAKALSARTTGAPLTTSATQTGAVLGTPAYMSPEQARGQSVDERADIWAFGCVLFEMLARHPPFASQDVTLTPASLRASGATVDGLVNVPPAVRRTIKLCLESDVRKRIRHIGDVRLALDGAFESSAPTPAAAPTRHRWTSLTAYAVVALAFLALAVPALRHLREMPPPETRVDIVTPPTSDPTSFELSPDGQQIVFVAAGPSGTPQLWLRSLATATAQPLAGTEGAVFPFWAPNSRSIGFFTEGSLKRLDLGAGAPRTLTSANNGAGGTWNADDVIVFAPSLTTPLMQIAANGGAATPVFALGARQFGYSNPHFLPDGRRLVYSATGNPEVSGVYIGALGSDVTTRLTPSDGSALYLPTGWLVWVRGGALVAQRLDLSRSALTGKQVTLADGVALDFRWRSGISAASNGLIAYRGGGGSRRQLTWFDRSGSQQGTLGEPDGFSLSQPRLTPDDRRAVVTRTVEGNFDLWLLDGSRTTRLTFDPARDDFQEVSPDGSEVVFRSLRTRLGDLYMKLLGRADPEQLLLESDELKVPTGWSADGRFLMYMSINPVTSADLWVVPMQGDRTPYVFLQTPFREAYGAFSPDGRWVAYHSNESGRYEIYVRPFFEAAEHSAAAAGDQWQISTGGGVFATWRADGRELYYLDPSGAMMAASMTVTGNKLIAGSPQMLFRAHISRGGRDVQQGRQYDVAADGKFLIDIELNDDASTPITLIQNWNPDAKE
jgi:serine/threonine protein kinase/Tol biopolymer transport system component